jgi:V/A-type H+-transporting ATPase subunit I
MFKPEKISKINLFLLNKDAKKVIDALYDLELVELLEVKEEKLEKFNVEISEKLNSDLLKLRSIINVLEKYNTKKTNFNKKINNDILNEVEKLNLKLKELTKKEIALSDEINREKIMKLLKLNEKILSKDLIIGFINKENSNYLDELKKLKIKFRKSEFKDRIYFVILKENISKEDIPFNFKEFYLPKDLDNYEENKIKLKEIIDKKNNIKEELIFIANKYLKDLKKEEIRLKKQIDTQLIFEKFRKGENISLIQGYVETKKIKKLKKELNLLLGNKYELEIINFEKGEEVPTKLENPSLINKFENLLKMYSLPKYNEIDPTIFMFFTFPIFFGFILGDIGYGLISLIFFTVIKNKFKNLSGFISILQISSIISMIFGVIFGEFFGFEYHYGLLGLFPRIEDPTKLLLIAVIFGLFHINLGLILGFINELKTHGFLKALYEKLSWIVIELSALFLYLGFKLNQEINLSIGIILGILGLILIYLGEGFIGIIEVPSFFTNILSYARLMAVGLSSVAIAILINEFSVKLFSGGILSILGGVILFTIGHIFNIILGNFEGFLHTLRLHYVEHFTKFYKGGGKEFKPFGYNKE